MPDSQLNIKIIGQGIPFVFQHGLGANVAQAAQLLSGNKDVQWIFADMPGHGNSILTPDCIPSFDFYTDQLVLALDNLEVEKAHFGGISMGAGIALNMALRYPEKVQSLFLLRPAWIDEGTPENLKVLLEAAKLIGTPKGIEQFKSDPTFLKINNMLPKVGNSLLGIFDKDQQKGLPSVLKAMVNDKPFDNLEVLKKIAIPCRIVGNDDDPLHPYTIAEKTNEYIPESKLHKVTSRYINSAAHQKEITELITKHLL